MSIFDWLGVVLLRRMVRTQLLESSPDIYIKRRGLRHF